MPCAKGKPKPMYITSAMLALCLASPAGAGTIFDAILHDGSIDLRVLTLGRELSIDGAFAAIGVRVDPDDWSEIDAEPTRVSTLQAGCSWGLPRSLLALRCESVEVP